MRKILFLIFLHYSTGAGAVVCQELFEDAIITRTITELGKLRRNLDLAKVLNQDTLATSTLESEYRIKEQELFNYLSASNLLSLAEVKTKIKAAIARLQRRSVEEKEKEVEARSSQADIEFVVSREMIFNPVKRGKVYFENNEVRIAPFHLMSTVTTVAMWRDVVELIHKYIGVSDSLPTNPTPDRDDKLPVGSVSYEDIQQWISGLNTLSEKDIPELKVLIPSHHVGDKYSLPSEAQWLYVLTSGGTNYDSRFFFGDDMNQLGDYAWYQANSDHKIKAVAQLQPMKLHGYYYYDVVGNVWQLMSGINPNPNTKKTALAIIRGGSVSQMSPWLQNDSKKIQEVTIRASLVGFRLIRQERQQ